MLGPRLWERLGGRARVGNERARRRRLESPLRPSVLPLSRSALLRADPVDRPGPGIDEPLKRGLDLLGEEDNKGRLILKLDLQLDLPPLLVQVDPGGPNFIRVRLLVGLTESSPVPPLLRLPLRGSLLIVRHGLRPPFSTSTGHLEPSR